MRKDPAISVAFGDAVRQLRLAQRKTQEQVSTAAEVDRSFLARVELGQVAPSITTAYAIAAALGVSFSQLSTLFEQHLGKRRNEASHLEKSS